MTRSEYDILTELYERWLNLEDWQLKMRDGCEHETEEEFNKWQAELRKENEEKGWVDPSPPVYQMYNGQYIEFNDYDIRHQMNVLHGLLSNYEAKRIRKYEKSRA